ncbi:hypothetical protein BKM20_29075 [Pseudomonas avellanae]|uniref:Uncharacterized protein n=2 Tax=Pseudomonas syringae group TaxID=136849 RepID=A0A3M2WJS3_PSEA0|nr:hypothetical protein PSYMP_26828 [Pseudomonas amygdali pv. morsprunorum str. M302280]POC81501.1 hypothetical protein BKM26_28995 [Pseudomonas avellanae]RML50958.1 hypothetical protein ALQ94_200115 [Pseudomonas amygdali pv. morsprunorum]SPF10621.1 hypothetical protein PSCFBP3800_00550 [Pseudomonas syringae group genomosp. 3]POC98174.1 hypothetical protein BKM20_29075 [Pseudomonas avellanae]
MGFIILVNLKLDVWPWLNGGPTAAFLRAEATGSVTSDLLVGLFSAYVFYVVIELIPRSREVQLALIPLNLITASVIDAYERTRIYGHETPITSIDVAVLAMDNLNAHKSSVVTETDLLKLKFAMETAHSRYPDFQHCLTMAASISPEHALDWLVLTDKVRLLAEEYGSWPVSPFSNNWIGEPDEQQRLDPDCVAANAKYKDDMKNKTGALKLRVLEVIEATIFWMQRQVP